MICVSRIKKIVSKRVNHMVVAASNLATVEHEICIFDDSKLPRNDYVGGTAKNHYSLVEGTKIILLPIS